MTHRHDESATKILMIHLLLWTKKHEIFEACFNLKFPKIRQTREKPITINVLIKSTTEKNEKKNFEKNVKIDQPPEKKRIFRSAAMSGRYWQTRPSQANQHNRRNSPRKTEFWSNKTRKKSSKSKNSNSDWCWPLLNVYKSLF